MFPEKMKLLNGNLAWKGIYKNRNPPPFAVSRIVRLRTFEPAPERSEWGKGWLGWEKYIEKLDVTSKHVRQLTNVTNTLGANVLRWNQIIRKEELHHDRTRIETHWSPWIQTGAQNRCHRFDRGRCCCHHYRSRRLIYSRRSWSRDVIFTPRGFGDRFSLKVLLFGDFVYRRKFTQT